MCCTTTHLGKGDAALSRCIPLASGAIQASSLLAPVKRIAVSSLAKGAFLLLLHLHDQRAFHSPRGTLDRNFRVPAHEQREISILPCAIPSTNPTRVGYAPTVPYVGSRPAVRPLDFDQGSSLDAYSYCMFFKVKYLHSFMCFPSAECPLWVESGHMISAIERPLFDEGKH